VLRDQLIGDVVQVCTDDLRLWADSQDVVAHPLDQSSLPARSDGAEGVPCMASDKTKLRRLNPEFPLNIGVGLLLTDPAASPVRATDDVDVIVEVA
jgi:hypothetical protein